MALSYGATTDSHKVRVLLIDGEVMLEQVVSKIGGWLDPYSLFV